MDYAKPNDSLVLLYSQNEDHPDTENIMKIVTAINKD